MNTAITIHLGDLAAEVTRKDIKNVHLSVLPPSGAVRVSAPAQMDVETIRLFLVGKLGWIRRHQRKVAGQEREPRREYMDRESHYVWGRRYLLRVEERDAGPGISLGHSELVLHIRPGTPTPQRETILDNWYRSQVKLAAQPLVAKWEPRMGVQAGKIFVQRMKTRWGGCNPSKGSIRLNTDLARKPGDCLEYVVVHELAHLLEPTHNARCAAIMDQFLPQWRLRKETLNRLPVRHQDWGELVAAPSQARL